MKADVDAGPSENHGHGPRLIDRALDRNISGRGDRKRGRNRERSCKYTHDFHPRPALKCCLLDQAVAPQRWHARVGCERSQDAWSGATLKYSAPAFKQPLFFQRKPWLSSAVAVPPQLGMIRAAWGKGGRLRDYSRVLSRLRAPCSRPASAACARRQTGCVAVNCRHGAIAP